MEVSSSDELNGFESRTKKRDKLHLNVQNAAHAFDVDSDSPPSNAVASTSRIHEDGPATRSLQQRLEMSPSARSTSPIEQFGDEQKPSTIRVTELRKRFEGGDEPHEDRGKPHENRDKPPSPFVDFRGVPSLKVNMKAKVPKVSKTCWRNGGDLIDSSQLEASGSCSHFFYALPKRTSFCRCKVICLFAAHESMLF